LTTTATATDHDYLRSFLSLSTRRTTYSTYPVILPNRDVNVHDVVYHPQSGRKRSFLSRYPPDLAGKVFSLQYQARVTAPRLRSFSNVRPTTAQPDCNTCHASGPVCFGNGPLSAIPNATPAQTERVTAHFGMFRCPPEKLHPSRNAGYPALRELPFDWRSRCPGTCSEAEDRTAWPPAAAGSPIPCMGDTWSRSAQIVLAQRGRYSSGGQALSALMSRFILRQ